MLPDGEVTHSFRKYVGVWRANGVRLAELFGGGHLSAFDPGYSIDTLREGRVEIDKEVGRKLIALLDELEKLRQENSELKKRLKK